jgi:hypothetical protein
MLLGRIFITAKGATMNFFIDPRGIIFLVIGVLALALSSLVSLKKK